MTKKGSKYAGGGMASKLFKGKETFSEELAEAKAIKSGKITPKQYAKGEQSEGVHGKNKTKKMDMGGVVPPAVNESPAYLTSQPPLVDKGAMGGKRFMNGPPEAVVRPPKMMMSERQPMRQAQRNQMARPPIARAMPIANVPRQSQTPVALPPATMKSGGAVKKMARGGGIEIRGKTKGRFV